MLFKEKILIENLRMVDEVIDFDDDDIGSCSLGLQKVKEMYPNDEIIFCNGGDEMKKIYLRPRFLVLVLNLM